MSLLLQQLDIFELRPVIANISCKLSTITEYCDGRRQLLCLVSEENDIFLRYTNDSGLEVSKVITWFRRLNQIIHDVCFDPSGTWLLVLCFDNTLHILPALSLVDKSFEEAKNQQLPYSVTHVTSYIIPFVGPHECPNSQKCPNPNPSNDEESPQNSKDKKTQQSCVVEYDNNENSAGDEQKTNSAPADDGNELADGIKKLDLREKLLSDSDKLNTSINDDLEAFSHDVPDEMLSPSAPQEQVEDKTGNSQVMTTSFMASNTCPYPTSVVWWQTIDGLNRAIIGYSDGSICFVGLSPNCPFVASTAIQNGSVVKLNICKDNTFESVMLLITSSMKQQFKLLLEQKAIKYIYPGEISPTSSQPRNNDWQIVMPVKASGSEANEVNSYEVDAMIRELPITQVTTNDTAPITTTSTQKPTVSISAEPTYSSSSPVPPPPYSVAIARHSGDSAPVTAEASSTETVDGRFQQHPLSDLDDGGRVGILPAARARLASLKSLGSKKLNAIKMRLSDNRQKLEEQHIPDNTHGSFAILDSPSTTPEPLGISGFFYTIQNLRNTYLLSALHCKERTLSVHNIDANLKLLFLYKIPKNCYDILISSNILYSIQYVDLKEGSETPVEVPPAAETVVSTSQMTQGNTEKENRDTEMEKEEKYADAKLTEVVDLSEDDDKLMPDAVASESTDTSATSSGGVTVNNSESQSNLINAVGIISSAMARFQLPKFNEAAQLGVFRFENETVLNLYQMATYQPAEQTEPPAKEDKPKVAEYKDIRSPMDYLQFYETADVEKEYSLRQVEILQNEFPKINYDPCYVVTNKNVYYIQLKKKPFEIFLEAALAGEWNQCREFCTTFDLAYEPCVEFAGDYLLRNRKITQALLTYNNALIKPIRTALKLAMFGQTSTLLLFCAMALKITHLLSSKYFCNPIIKTILKDITYRHSEDVRSVMPPVVGSQTVNEGEQCSDYVYGVDDSISSLQMSPSSQFHLANLLLITLAEKSVNDKNYIPLWNFLVTNTKYHTNMTSIVLCQSGLFSAALILAKTRGVCIDTFLALTSVVNQEFGWYTEVNSCLYNLSEDIFVETLTYLPQVSMEYFCFIQEKLDVIHLSVLKRVAAQLNPFAAAMRPIVSHTSSAGHLHHKLNDNNNIYLFEYCKCLIETYLGTLIRAEYRSAPRDYICNALNTFRISYEDNQFAIDSHKFKPISAGCAHCACVVDGVAYFWGSNGVPCSYSANKSSDPPEPPHAVKSLDLLSQLNLEVHAVKCGRQHTLVLTNNGLYAFGNNNLRQLGIGSGMLMALQPVMVKALDGKCITILEAGQYHNAAVADGELYTWGWGVYGQLGHGDIENVDEPKRVEFFRNKKVIQVSLGHAHTLVLCRRHQSQRPSELITELYVFGSNHFGQLGISAKGLSSDGVSGGSDTDLGCGTQVKSSVPLKLNVSTANIRLIHTKFFTNLAIDEDERMYTWGSSPQALRLANQIKRRANAKQKIEEMQKRSVSKRFEATVLNVATDDVPSTSATASTTVSDGNSDPNVNPPARAAVKPPENRNVVKTAADVTQPTLKVELIDDVEEDIVNSSTEFTGLTREPQVEMQNDDDILDEKKIDFSQSKPQSQEQHQQPIIEPESCEHMTPQLVDTSEVAGEILQVSSGLFHFALISSSCTLYTWGKNLEHQLGTMDKERRAVNKPSPIDSIELPMYVDCGADFTLVMTTEYVVKAFGGNSNGQCGRDLGPSLDKFKQRFVPLPASKRLLRFESQCVEVPVEINLPRPRITLSSEPVRYLKSIPIFKRGFIQEADIDLDQDDFDRPSPSNQYKSTTQGDSTDNVIDGQDSDDLISSLENLSNNDACSLNSSLNQVKLRENNSTPSQQISGEDTPEDQSYIPLSVNNDNVERSRGTDSVNQQLVPKQTEGLVDLDSSYQLQVHIQDTEQKNARNFIHYCLYVFHGLYNPEKVNEFSKEQTEFRIRTAMLNFKFIDAFKLCLQDCNSSRPSLKIFEYFTKDTGYVPMRRQDLKYFIYYLFVHFLANKFDMLECERFFLGDLEFYLLELAYVLYFNNNNTVLEQELNQKFKSLIAQEDTNQNEQEHKLHDTDIIFDSLSVKFKAIVCQRLLKHCN